MGVRFDCGRRSMSTDLKARRNESIEKAGGERAAASMIDISFTVRDFRYGEDAPCWIHSRFDARQNSKAIPSIISLTTSSLCASLRSSCSQILRIEIPLALSKRLMARALALFPSIFDFQYRQFVFGSRRHLGHPCQKHPSTNTAKRRSENQKSGWPATACGCICHPLIPRRTRANLSRRSVERFPLDRTFDISALRSRFVSVSICAKVESK